MADIPQWQLKGDWFDVCSCNIPCPCEFAQPPTNNICYGVLAYHIREGHYGNVPLAGLNLILVGTFEGNLWAGQATGFKLGLFLDARANAQQQEALQTIFSGQAGGVPAQLSAIWRPPELLGMEVVPITFEVANDLAFWRAEVPGKVVAHAGRHRPHDPAGAARADAEPAGLGSGPWAGGTWGKATTHRVEALGLQWDWTGKSSKHIPFDWMGPA